MLGVPPAASIQNQRPTGDPVLGTEAQPGTVKEISFLPPLITAAADKKQVWYFVSVETAVSVG